MSLSLILTIKTQTLIIFKLNCIMIQCKEVLEFLKINHKSDKNLIKTIVC